MAFVNPNSLASSSLILQGLEDRRQGRVVKSEADDQKKLVSAFGSEILQLGDSTQDPKALQQGLTQITQKYASQGLSPEGMAMGIKMTAQFKQDIFDQEDRAYKLKQQAKEEALYNTQQQDISTLDAITKQGSPNTGVHADNLGGGLGDLSYAAKQLYQQDAAELDLIKAKTEDLRKPTVKEIKDTRTQNKKDYDVYVIQQKAQGKEVKSYVDFLDRNVGKGKKPLTEAIIKRAAVSLLNKAQKILESFKITPQSNKGALGDAVESYTVVIPPGGRKEVERALGTDYMVLLEDAKARTFKIVSTEEAKARVSRSLTDQPSQGINDVKKITAAIEANKNNSNVLSSIEQSALANIRDNLSQKDTVPENQRSFLDFDKSVTGDDDEVGMDDIWRG